MKRAAELKSLSEDHHHSLVHARRLRRAASGEGDALADAARGFLGFWQAETSGHFRKEEEVLLPVYARHGGTSRVIPSSRCTPSTPGSGASSCG